MKFKKTDIIKTDGEFWECIVSDKRTAVFGKITEWTEVNKRVSYEYMFAVDQKVQDNFNYELVKHHYVVVVPDSDGGL